MLDVWPELCEKRLRPRIVSLLITTPIADDRLTCRSFGFALSPPRPLTYKLLSGDVAGVVGIPYSACKQLGLTLLAHEAGTGDALSALLYCGCCFTTTPTGILARIGASNLHVFNTTTGEASGGNLTG